MNSTALYLLFDINDSQMRTLNFVLEFDIRTT